MSHSRRFVLRLLVTSVGFMFVIGHGGPNCSECGSCPDVDYEAVYFDVEGCWFDGLELRYPACRRSVTLHPGGQSYDAGLRGSPPRSDFSLRALIGTPSLHGDLFRWAGDRNRVRRLVPHAGGRPQLHRDAALARHTAG